MKGDTMPPRDTSTTSDQPLSDYVKAFMDSSELSARQFADRCRDPESGRFLNHTYVGSLRQNRVPRAPELWRLKALAAGTGGNLDELKRMAAIQWLDLGDVLRVDAGGGTFVTVTVPEDMSERRRQKLIRWAEAMAREDVADEDD